MWSERNRKGYKVCFRVPFKSRTRPTKARRDHIKWFFKSTMWHWNRVIHYLLVQIPVLLFVLSSPKVQVVPLKLAEIRRPPTVKWQTGATPACVFSFGFIRVNCYSSPSSKCTECFFLKSNSSQNSEGTHQEGNCQICPEALCIPGVAYTSKEVQMKTKCWVGHIEENTSIVLKALSVINHHLQRHCPTALTSASITEVHVLGMHRERIDCHLSSRGNSV